MSCNIVGKYWNTAFRWLFSVRKFEGTGHIFNACNTMSMRFLLDKKLIRFYCSSIYDNNMLIRTFAYMACKHRCLKNVLSRYNLTLLSRPTEVDIYAKIHSVFIHYGNE